MDPKGLFSSWKEFDGGVRLVSKPWADTGSKTNIILEDCSTAMDCLLRARRVYIEWMSFPLRTYDEVTMYYRCSSFDHMVEIASLEGFRRVIL